MNTITETILGSITLFAIFWGFVFFGWSALPFVIILILLMTISKKPENKEIVESPKNEISNSYNTYILQVNNIILSESEKTQLEKLLRRKF